MKRLRAKVIGDTPKIYRDSLSRIMRPIMYRDDGQAGGVDPAVSARTTMRGSYGVAVAAPILHTKPAHVRSTPSSESGFSSQVRRRVRRVSVMDVSSNPAGPRAPPGSNHHPSPLSLVVVSVMIESATLPPCSSTASSARPGPGDRLMKWRGKQGDRLPGRRRWLRKWHGTGLGSSPPARRRLTPRRDALLLR